MTQRAKIFAMRRLMYLNAGHMDVSHFHPDEAVRERAAEIVGLLTPICKSWGTDTGVELTSMAMQVFGGMGYIEETGVAQHLRDVRISTIYEGTNGVQAADLVGRKLPVREGKSVLEFLASMREVDADLEAAGEGFASIRSNLTAGLDALDEATMWMFKNGLKNPNDALAGSSPYQEMWGIVLGGWLMARTALAARGTDREASEHVLAKYFAEQILPEASGLLGAATAGSDDLFALDPKQLGARA